MTEKKFILNADDFGMSNEINRAILYANGRGFLKSASLCANGDAFDNAVNEVLPECPSLGAGVHLNISVGKALTRCHLLTDSSGNFNKNYLALLINSENKEFKKQIEAEFRAQIEKIKRYTAPDHINSHFMTHSIPEIFKITVKLAKEYNIPYIRTHHEEFYTIPALSKHLNLKYPVNLFKIAVLNHFAQINKKYLKESGIKTNDYLIGIGYAGMTDDMTIQCGLEALPDENCIAEALIHPSKYEASTKNSRAKEFLIPQNRELENKIYGLGFEITNYRQI